MRLQPMTLAVLVLIPLHALAQKPAAQPVKSADASATYQDIQKTLGMVPTFMKQYPPEGIAAAWEHFKAAQLTEGAMPAKYKELTGLAVASQIPCTYCVYAHTQFAKMNGATDAEIKEAVALAALTRAWSTYLQGVRADEAQFAKDLQSMFKAQPTGATGGSGSAGTGAPQMSMKPVKTAEEAKAEMQKTFGVVPGFMTKVPAAALPSLWNHTKQFELAETAVPAKYKALIGLGVSAQVPCTYCVMFDTENSKANNATQQEMGEALMMAANTRLWSTVLNGSAVDDAQFRREIDQLVKNAKSKMGRGTGGSGQKKQQ